MRKLFSLFFIFCISAAACATTRSIQVAPDVDVPVSVYGQSQQRLILWLPSEHGVVGPEHALAAQLAKRGYEVWVADLFAARFLPVTRSSLNEIPAADVARLLQAAAQQHHHITLISSGQGASRALEGAQLWQQTQRTHRALAGAVLLFPDLYAASPEAGEAPTYLPVVSQTRLHLAVIQGERSPWYWQLDDLKSKLEQGGSRVQIKTLPGIRDRFYFREDANPSEHAAGRQLAATIHRSIQQLSAIPLEKKP